MYSRLDPIFRSQLRLTEKLDTRVGIRRDEQQEERRKKGEKKEEENESDLWDDSTGVSVPALKAILQDFIQPKSASDTGQGPQDKTSVSSEPTRPENLQAAKATRAYQHSAEISHGEPPAPPPHADNAATTSATPKLSTDEQRLIHRLIGDLEMLEKNDVHEITIKLTDDFLQSIIRAIEEEKARTNR